MYRFLSHQNEAIKTEEQEKMLYVDDNARTQGPRVRLPIAKTSTVNTIIQKLQDDLTLVEPKYEDLKEALASEKIVIYAEWKSLLEERELVAQWREKIAER